jgi:hypothetical protein
MVSPSVLATILILHACAAGVVTYFVAWGMKAAGLFSKVLDSK